MFLPFILAAVFFGAAPALIVETQPDTPTHYSAVDQPHIAIVDGVQVYASE